jgi:hypothetical protein
MGRPPSWGNNRIFARVARGAAGVLIVLGLASLAAAGVRYGDAVPGIIKKSDLERIRRQLDLERFSVIAAVWLGAVDGREAIIAEPLSDETLAKVKGACEGGGFCPDPVGFVASRVRVVLLRDNLIEPVLRIDQEARGAHGRLFDLGELGTEGTLLGWNGYAEAFAGHVALALTPITERADGRVGAGADPPFLIRWNEDAGRFQLYDCVSDPDEGTVCAFETEADQ